ncbi:alpha/beta hydrolase [Roseomonas sp. SSH11]|uniref:Alpha/beta hydrolase n=1 Tax=Pararoseomonas baculiformis TaxID=2820812 RepID=A0ABS4AKR4_9PROT|nr:alpha/beta hydrolase [Pararoseomonas baculiformis]MBP0447629.1 alpha/beta hydrolase [Pararoseomonas baculiformis]
MHAAEEGRGDAGVLAGSPEGEAVAERHNLRVAGAAGPTMIFAHGYGCDASMWRLVAPHFVKSWRTALFDHVGSGRSRVPYDPDRYATLDGYADDVLAICRALGPEPVVFVGHSVSAMIGVLAASREPERFSRLVLIGPSPCYINEGEYQGGFTREDIESLLSLLEADHDGWAKAMAPTIMANPDRPELAEELTESFCRVDPQVARHFARVTFTSDNRADLARVRTPALVIQSADDAIAPCSVGHYVHRHLCASKLVVLDTSGHCPHLSDPGETTAAIRNFLLDA